MRSNTYIFRDWKFGHAGPASHGTEVQVAFDGPEYSFSDLLDFMTFASGGYGGPEDCTTPSAVVRVSGIPAIDQEPIVRQLKEDDHHLVPVLLSGTDRMGLLIHLKPGETAEEHAHHISEVCRPLANQEMSMEVYKGSKEGEVYLYTLQ